LSDDFEYNFYADQRGNLNTALIMDGESYTEIMDDHDKSAVVVWYDQSCAGNDAMQHNNDMQPIYSYRRKIITFRCGQYLELLSYAAVELQLGRAGDDWTLAIYHGAIYNRTGGGLVSTVGQDFIGKRRAADISIIFYDNSSCVDARIIKLETGS